MFSGEHRHDHNLQIKNFSNEKQGIMVFGLISAAAGGFLVMVKGNYESLSIS